MVEAQDDKPKTKPKVPSLKIPDEKEGETGSKTPDLPDLKSAGLGQSSRQQQLSSRAGQLSARDKTGSTSARATKPQQSVFCVKAEIKGNVIFGDGCVLHPQCTIDAEGGDIIFGDCNIIEEYVKIVNYARKDAQGNIVRRTMRIGSYNLFEVGAIIESTDIGDLNEFGVKSAVLAGS